MKWDREAEEAIRRVPFFIRKRVKGKVEAEAQQAGARVVRMEHLRAAKDRFMRRMEEEVLGYRVETCFGPSGCPNRAVADEDLAGRLEKLIAAENLLEFLKEKVDGPLKLHHEFRVSVSDCPNACSRPQIADLGLIGARRPAVGTEPCSLCGSCREICREEAMALTEGDQVPVIDYDRCLSCGQCLDVCPTGTLEETSRGYRALLGGRLGRHPRLGREISGIYTASEVLSLVGKFLRHYKSHNRNGERWGDILNRVGYEDLDPAASEQGRKD